MSAIERIEPRDVINVQTGESLDVLHDAGQVADYLDWLREQIRILREAERQAERAILNRMDDALVGVSASEDGKVAVVKDPVDHSSVEWDVTELAKLYHQAPDDPELAKHFQERVDAAVRPEVTYKPLKRELAKLASERPDLAGIIADAEVRRAKPRHVRVNRKGQS